MTEKETRNPSPDAGRAAAPPPRTVLLVGLTGGIATGKSEVDRVLESLGARVLDADRIVHRLLASDKGLQAAISAAFGPGVMDSGGAVDRKALGRIVFHDPAARERLNGLVHPLVRREIRTESDRLCRPPAGPDVLVVDAALMVETGFYRNFDRLVVVTASLETRIRRLAERDGFDRETALARIATQGPDEAKFAAAQYVIVNDGSLLELAGCTAKVWEALQEDLRRKAAAEAEAGGPTAPPPQDRDEGSGR